MDDIQQENNRVFKTKAEFYDYCQNEYTPKTVDECRRLCHENYIKEKMKNDTT